MNRVDPDDRPSPLGLGCSARSELVPQLGFANFVFGTTSESFLPADSTSSRRMFSQEIVAQAMLNPSRTSGELIEPTP